MISAILRCTATLWGSEKIEKVSQKYVLVCFWLPFQKSPKSLKVVSKNSIFKIANFEKKRTLNVICFKRNEAMPHGTDSIFKISVTSNQKPSRVCLPHVHTSIVRCEYTH